MSNERKRFGEIEPKTATERAMKSTRSTIVGSLPENLEKTERFGCGAGFSGVDA